MQVACLQVDLCNIVMFNDNASDNATMAPHNLENLGFNRLYDFNCSHQI